jgi:hypothetical protein
MSLDISSVGCHNNEPALPGIVRKPLDELCLSLSDKVGFGTCESITASNAN